MSSWNKARQLGHLTSSTKLPWSEDIIEELQHIQPLVHQRQCLAMIIRYSVELVTVPCKHTYRSVDVLCASPQDDQAEEIEDTWRLLPVNRCGNLSAGLLFNGTCISLKIINFNEANLSSPGDLSLKLCPVFGNIPQIDYKLANGTLSPFELLINDLVRMFRFNTIFCFGNEYETRIVTPVVVEYGHLPRWETIDPDFISETSLSMYPNLLLCKYDSVENEATPYPKECRNGHYLCTDGTCVSQVSLF